LWLYGFYGGINSKTLFEHRLTNRILGWILLEMW
jgi:hypothetical protein